MTRKRQYVKGVFDPSEVTREKIKTTLKDTSSGSVSEYLKRAYYAGNSRDGGPVFSHGRNFKSKTGPPFTQIDLYQKNAEFAKLSDIKKIYANGVKLYL